MDTLVTGSDFLGSALVKRLGKNTKVFADDAVKYRGDIRDIVALQTAFPADIVYHLAASFDESSTQMYEINVDGTENVVRLCRKYKVKQLVFMSSSGVLGETLIPARETFDYNPRTAYERSKAECERIIKESGVPYTIVRAPVILGANRIWQNIFRAAKHSHPIIGTGKNKLHLAYIDDIVDLLVHVKNNKSAMNEIFHVATADIPTYKEVYAMICRELGTEMTSKKISVPAAKTYAALDSFKSIIKGQKPVAATGINNLVASRMLNTDKVRKVLGFKPCYNTKKAIKAVAKELKERKMI